MIKLFLSLLLRIAETGLLSLERAHILVSSASSRKYEEVHWSLLAAKIESIQPYYETLSKGMIRQSGKLGRSSYNKKQEVIK